MGQAEATRQSDNLRPPRRGQIVAVTVDTTARPYDLSAVAWPNAMAHRAGADGVADTVFVTLIADGADVIYHFSPVTASDLNEATVDAVGTTPLTVANAHGARCFNGTKEQHRLIRQTDRWLIVKTAAGTATLRLFFSSEATAPGAT